MWRLLILLAVLLPLPALAAFEARVVKGDGVAHVQFLLSATTTSVNAVEGTLLIPEGASVSKLYIGESIIGSWVEAPKVEEGRIRFAGIIPGGFTGSASPGKGLTDPAELFSFELYGEGSLVVSEAAHYLNDGIGTRVRIASMVVPETAGAGEVLQEDDRTPPEYVEAVSDTKLVEGKHVLLISAFDADSGIDHFEVQEGNGEWVVVGTFYEVRDAHGFSSISVRAYDRAGNFTETRVEGRNAPYAKLAFLGAVLLALLILGTLLVYLKKRRT